MLDDPRVETFVGRNVAYYRKAWQQFIDKPGSKISLNWAALLGNMFWLAYRKLYWPLLWVTIVMCAAVGLELYVEEMRLAPAWAHDVWGIVASLLLLGIVGLFGNYWYWKKFLRTSGAVSPEQLRSRGGTSAVAPTLVVVALLSPVAWALYHAAPVLLSDDYDSYMFGRTGPLTLEEVRANLVDRMDLELAGARRECVFREIEVRAAAAVDPEMLDPSTVEMLPAREWTALDADGKRLILSQVITTKALFECPRGEL